MFQQSSKMKTAKKCNSVLLLNATLFYRCFALCFLLDAGLEEERGKFHADLSTLLTTKVGRPNSWKVGWIKL